MTEALLLMGGIFLVLFVGGLIVNWVLLLVIPRKRLGGLYLCLSVLWGALLAYALARPSSYDTGWGGLGFLIWFPILAVMVVFGIGLLASRNKKSGATAENPPSVSQPEETEPKSKNE